LDDAVDDDDRLKRHDLTDAEWARLAPLLRVIPGKGTGGMITGW
jgi:hypothetical protein